MLRPPSPQKRKKRENVRWPLPNPPSNSGQYPRKRRYRRLPALSNLDCFSHFYWLLTKYFVTECSLTNLDTLYPQLTSELIPVSLLKVNQNQNIFRNVPTFLCFFTKTSWSLKHLAIRKKRVKSFNPITILM